MLPGTVMMTREEFAERQAEAQDQIPRQCVPWGLIYAFWLGGFIGTLMASACLLLSLHPQPDLFAGAVFSGEIIVCLSLIVGAHWFFKRNLRRYVRWNVDCPSCHRSLVFPRNWETEEIAQNRCPGCQEPIFEDDR